MSFLSFLRTIRILDEDDTVSLSSLLLYFACALIIFFHDSPLVFGVFVCSLVHANLKRLSANGQANRNFKLEIRRERKRSEYQEDLARIEERLNALDAEQKKLSQISNISRLGR